MSKEKKEKIEITFFEFLFWCSTPYLLCQFLHLTGEIKTFEEAHSSGLVGVCAAVALNLLLIIFGKERIISRRKRKEARMAASAGAGTETAAENTEVEPEESEEEQEEDSRSIDLVYPDSSSQYALTLDVIGGDDGLYRVLFFFHNAVSEPTQLDVTADGFDVSVKEGPYEYSYYALLRNQTEKADNKPFEKPREVSCRICADFEKDGRVEGSFDIRINPEGLTVRCYELQRDRMVINAYEDENATEWDYTVRPTRFEVNYASSEIQNGYSKARFLCGKQLELQFLPLTGDREYTETFGKTFRWHIDRKYQQDGEYSFFPEVVLPQKDPYEADLPLTCTVSGSEYGLDVPLLIKGREIPKAPADWNREMEALRKDVLYFGLSDNPEIRSMISKAPSFTANEICMLRRAIISEAMAYYTAEGDEFTQLDQSLSKYEFAFSVWKWIMDQAFTYCVIACCHGNTTVEAFLSPLKDMVGEFLGEYTASVYWGEPCSASADIFRVAVTGTEKMLGYKVRDTILTGSLSKAGGAFAAFLFITWLDKFSMPGACQGDIYKATVATVNTAASTAIKLMFLKYFKQFVENTPAIRDTLHKFFFDACWKRCMKQGIDPDKAAEMLLNTSDEATHTLGIMIKLLTETVGLSVTVFLENVEKQAARLGSANTKPLSALCERETFDIDITVGKSVIRINILNNLEAIANYVFEVFFGVMQPTKQTPAEKACEQYYKNSAEVIAKLQSGPDPEAEERYARISEQRMLGM